MSDDMRHTSPIEDIMAEREEHNAEVIHLGWKHRLHLYMNELPGALSLAVLTAVTTLILAIVLSAVLGQANEEHRIAQRCFAHESIYLMREIIQETPSLRDKIDLSDYPAIDIAGVDCTKVFEGR